MDPQGVPSAEGNNLLATLFAQARTHPVLAVGAERARPGGVGDRLVFGVFARVLSIEIDPRGAACVLVRRLLGEELITRLGELIGVVALFGLQEVGGLIHHLGTDGHLPLLFAADGAEQGFRGKLPQLGQQLGLVLGRIERNVRDGAKLALQIDRGDLWRPPRPFAGGHVGACREVQQDPARQVGVDERGDFDHVLRIGPVAGAIDGGVARGMNGIEVRERPARLLRQLGHHDAVELVQGLTKVGLKLSGLRCSDLTP